ncbi:MAG: TIGR02253 family HAD-type hydrolase [Candidatus Altiarchaeota archaeon]|nr:TIGR02253 family HAD-type hydrolase [Candidatus Altiarchaeota archaeon]
MEDKIKVVFFDIDDTLYDSSMQTERARKNAIKAMIEAGLDVDEDKALEVLHGMIKKFGSNYQYQFDELLKEFDYDPNPRIIAAGVVAYHTTKVAYLVPFPDTVPMLLRLRDLNYKLGVITDGIAVKQWEKLIRLGVQHFFHFVTISGDTGSEKPDPELFRRAIDKSGCAPGETMMVGDRLDKDVKGANEAGMVTVQVMRGKYREVKPREEIERPDYVVSKLSDILRILG